MVVFEMRKGREGERKLLVLFCCDKFRGFMCYFKLYLCISWIKRKIEVRIRNLGGTDL